MLLKYYTNGTPSPVLLKQLSQSLQADKLLIIPTDTAYSICCNALSISALGQLADIKGVDPEQSHFTIMCQDLSQASEYAKLDNEMFRMMKQNTPGPFTFILPTSSALPRIYKGRKEVGIRIPRHELVLSLIRSSGSPLTGFSLPELPQQLEDIAYDFNPELINELWGDKVEHVVDGGIGSLQESAIIDCTSTPYTIVREGPEELKL